MDTKMQTFKLTDEESLAFRFLAEQQARLKAEAENLRLQAKLNELEVVGLKRRIAQKYNLKSTDTIDVGAGTVTRTEAQVALVDAVVTHENNGKAPAAANQEEV